MTFLTVVILYLVVGFTVSTMAGIFYKQIHKYKLYTTFNTYDQNFREFHFWFWLVGWPIFLADLILGIIFNLIGLFLGGSLIKNYLNYITNIIK